MDLKTHLESAAILKRIEDLKALKIYLNQHVKGLTVRFSVNYNIGNMENTHNGEISDRERLKNKEINESDFKCMLDAIDRRASYLKKQFNKL